MLSTHVRATLEAAARNRYWRESDAAVVLAAWSDSGQSLADFSRQWGINGARLRRWRRRMRDRELPAFHEVQLVFEDAAARESVGGSIELLLHGDRRIAVGPGFCPATLERLVRLVESWSC